MCLMRSMAVWFAQLLALLVFHVGSALANGPNFVIIVADDMRKDDLPNMPNVQSLLTQGGLEFTEAFVVNATCCPARAAILRGQYPHNSKVTRVGDGFEKFRTYGGETENLATHLQAAGYRTGLYGKYFVDYPHPYQPTYTPPGWEEWAAFGYVKAYYNYELIENGSEVFYGDTAEEYATDVLAAKVIASVQRYPLDPRPFFLYVTPFAPHAPSIPAPRHATMFDGKQSPRAPSFNEGNVSDKPAWVQALPKLTRDGQLAVDRVHRDRLRSLQSVDEFVAQLVATLDAQGVLANTFILFTSDQGFLMGEHRIKFTKGNSYEEAIRVPFVLRGPGVTEGLTSASLVLPTDIMPTLLDMAGVAIPDFVDGRSLRPLLDGSVPSTWRNRFLVEHPDPPKIKVKDTPGPHYTVRTKTFKYVEYNNGEREFYDLRTDPYELTNNYIAGRTVIQELASDLALLKSCAGAGCASVEDAP